MEPGAGDRGADAVPTIKTNIILRDHPSPVGIAIYVKFNDISQITKRISFSFHRIIMILSQNNILLFTISQLRCCVINLNSCIHLAARSCLKPLSNEQNSMFKSGDSRAV